MCFAVNFEQKSLRRMRPVAAPSLSLSSCESDHVFTAPVTALYRSVSQRYLMGRAKERGSTGPHPLPLPPPPALTMVPLRPPVPGPASHETPWRCY